MSAGICTKDFPTIGAWRAAVEAERKNRPDRERIDRAIIQNHRRRAAHYSAQGTVTYAEWRAVCDFYDNRCLRCGATDVVLTADHVVPLLQGGRNDTSNLQPLCLSCNSIKHAAQHDYRPRFL